MQPWLGDAIFFEEPLGITARAGNTYAGLQGQTISKGWFWHPSTSTESMMTKANILDHLANPEPKWTSLILNCPPNRNGRPETNIVNRLAEVGAAWNPVRRGVLPAQPLHGEHPIPPANAYATAFHTGEGPLRAIDGKSDVRVETCCRRGVVAPQSIRIDLGGVWSNASTLEYLPKQWNRTNTTDGDIASYTISTSTEGVTFTPVACGTWAGDSTTKIAEWAARDVGFLRLEVHTATGGYADVGGRTAKPALVSRPFPVQDTSYRLAARHSGNVADVTGQAPQTAPTSNNPSTPPPPPPPPNRNGRSSPHKKTSGPPRGAAGTARPRSDPRPTRPGDTRRWWTGHEPAVLSRC